MAGFIGVKVQHKAHMGLSFQLNIDIQKRSNKKVVFRGLSECKMEILSFFSDRGFGQVLPRRVAHVFFVRAYKIGIGGIAQFIGDLSYRILPAL